MRLIHLIQSIYINLKLLVINVMLRHHYRSIPSVLKRPHSFRPGTKRLRADLYVSCVRHISHKFLGNKNEKRNNETLKQPRHSIFTQQKNFIMSEALMPFRCSFPIKRGSKCCNHTADYLSTARCNNVKELNINEISGSG